MQFDFSALEYSKSYSAQHPRREPLVIPSLRACLAIKTWAEHMLRQQSQCEWLKLKLVKEADGSGDCAAQLVLARSIVELARRIKTARKIGNGVAYEYVKGVPPEVLDSRLGKRPDLARSVKTARTRPAQNLGGG